MDSFKNDLLSIGINIDYLNLDALYDCDADLTKVTKSNLVKYGKTFISSFFFYRAGYRYRHTIRYDCDKYKELDSSVLGLSNYEIFKLAFKYFLDDDIVFLNMDSIYDASESYVSSVINSIKNDTCEIIWRYGTLHELKIKETCPNISVFKSSNLMIYFNIWCCFQFAKIKSINVFFASDEYSERYINVASGNVLRVGRIRDSVITEDMF